MAVVTETAPLPTLMTPQNGNAEPKNKGGRPRKIPVAPETEERDYQITGDLDFWLKLSNFSTDDWTQHVAYLFRTAPIIDRKQGGRPSHLQKYCSAFEREDIMREHGSGSYRIDLCQIDPSTGKSFRVAQERFTIVNPKFPPNVPPGDWTEDKSNENWKWGMNQQNSTNGTANYPPGFNMEKMMERDEKMFDRAMGIAKEFAPKAKDDTLVTTLLTKLLDASLNKPEPKADTSMALVIELLRTDLKDAREEMRELRKVQNAPPPAPKGILEQMKELKPVIAEAVELFTQKNGGDQPWWAAPLQTIMEGVGEAIPSVVEMVKNGNQQRPQQTNGWIGPQPQAIGPSGVPVPVAQTQPQPAATTGPVGTAQSAPAPQPDPQANFTDEQKEYLAVTQRWGGFILLIAPQMVEHFKTSNGVEFRDWVLRMHGLLRWTDMCRELGPEYLLAMIAQHPGISADMMPVQIREQFVNEFFSQIDDEGEEDDPDDGLITIGGDEQPPQSKHTGTARRDRGSLYKDGGSDVA